MPRGAGSGAFRQRVGVYLIVRPYCMSHHLRTVIALLVAGGLLALFLRNTDLRQVGTEMARARLDLVVAALIVTGLTYVLRALRWVYLLAPIGRVRFSVALKTTVIG